MWLWGKKSALCTAQGPSSPCAQETSLSAPAAHTDRVASALQGRKLDRTIQSNLLKGVSLSICPAPCVLHCVTPRYQRGLQVRTYACEQPSLPSRRRCAMNGTQTSVASCLAASKMTMRRHAYGRSSSLASRDLKSLHTCSQSATANLGATTCKRVSGDVVTFCKDLNINTASRAVVALR